MDRDLSAGITKEARDMAVEKLQVYRKWFCSKVMQTEKRNAIVVLPIENLTPRYRDEARSRFDPIGVPMLFLSPIIRGPEFTIPIGQVPFESRVSGRTEHLPVAVSLLAAPGRDIELISQIEACLHEAGRPTNLQHCPVLLASHGVGGFIVKEALRRAYQQQYNFRHFLQALAGVVLFGTPHSTSEEIKSWQSPALLEQSGIISKKKKSLDPDDIERFAKFSLQFEQANVIAPILSIYETQPTKVKTPLWSVKKVPVSGRIASPAAEQRIRITKFGLDIAQLTESRPCS
ncbi:MAG: hypothetical protein Q9166_003687 [cf. Caloplaca sp. 2 TL-2023]